MESMASSIRLVCWNSLTIWSGDVAENWPA